MKYMMLIYMGEDAMDQTEREACYVKSAQLAQDLHTDGLYLAAAPLHPVSTATSVRVRDGRRLITDGPFAETREQLGGYFMVDAGNLDQAIGIAARIPGALVGTVEIRPVIEVAGLPGEEQSGTNDESQIRAIIADWMNAFAAKDIDRLMSHYDPNVVVFDVKPPFQTKGAAAWRRTWETCLPHFPATFQLETRDLSIIVENDLALAHWLFRFTGMEKDHPAMQTWTRASVGYRRAQGRWRIIHEHVSVPFHPETSRAAFTLEP